MNIDELVTRIYEKHRIRIKRDDPLFQILTLVLEQSYETERERHDIIKQQIDDVVRGATDSLNAHAITLKQDASETVREGMVRIDNLIDQRVGPAPAMTPTESKPGSPVLLIIGVLNLVAIVILAVVVWVSRTG